MGTGQQLNERVITKSFQKHFPPYSQELITAPFSRSFVILGARDQNGRPAGLQWQLNTAGEPLREFTPMNEGTNIFVAQGFNQIWVRNTSSLYVDVTVLVSPDVIEHSGATGDGASLYAQTDRPLPPAVSMARIVPNGGMIDLSEFGLKSPHFNVVLDNTSFLPEPLPIHGLLKGSVSGIPLYTGRSPTSVRYNTATGEIYTTYQVYNYHYSILVDHPVQNVNGTSVWEQQELGGVPPRTVKPTGASEYVIDFYGKDVYWGPYSNQGVGTGASDDPVLGGIVLLTVNGGALLDNSRNRTYLQAGDVIDVYCYYNTRYSNINGAHDYGWDLSGVEWAHLWSLTGNISLDDTQYYSWLYQ